jgi:hypothetical protein
MGILVLSFVVAFAGASGGRVDMGQIVVVVLRVCGYFAAGLIVGRCLPRLLQWGRPCRPPLTRFRSVR